MKCVQRADNTINNSDIVFTVHWSARGL